MLVVCINNFEDYVKMVNVWMFLVVYVVVVCNIYVWWMFVWLYGIYVYFVIRDRYRISGKNFRKLYWRIDCVLEIKWFVYKLKMFYLYFDDKLNVIVLKYGVF